MSRPLQVGVTGGIGSGKSVVCRIFDCLGIPVYDADTRAKNVMTTDGILVGQIKKEFGTLAYHPDGSLNRTFLSQATFGKKDRLAALNALVHPRVARDYETWLAALTHAPYVIREAALLYEAGVTATLDRVIVIQAPIPLRVQRVLARDPQRTEQEVRAIMDNQWPDEEKMKRADDIIVNDENHLVTPQVLLLHHQYLHLK